MSDDPLVIAERAVVGAALLEPDSVRFSGEHVTPEDFANPTLGRLYGLIVGMRSAGLPVDAMLVDKAAREQAIPGVTGASLYGLIEAVPTASNAGHYARIVREGAIRRRLTMFGTRARQLAESDADLSSVMNSARDEWEQVRGSIAAGMEAKPLAEILDGTDEYDWLIPSLIERQDRLILTGGEGAGKSTFVRQIAVLAAAGIHPMTFRPIAPIRVLVVDAENTEKQWRRNARPLADKARRLGSEDPTQTLHIACVSRMDITTERDLGSVHRLIDEHKPDLLVIGPLYRLIPRAINSDDDAAPMLAALDSLRARGLALVMEAHAGHAVTAGGQRDLRPRGSSALMGWPEFGFGLALDRDDPHLAHLVRWRGDRDQRDWPTSIRRGGEWPWTDDATALAGRWQPHHPEAS